MQKTRPLSDKVTEILRFENNFLQQGGLWHSFIYFWGCVKFSSESETPPLKGLTKSHQYFSFIPTKEYKEGFLMIGT